MRKMMLIFIFMLLPVMILAQEIKESTGMLKQQLGDVFDLGITAHAHNPWKNTMSGYEVGLSSWVYNTIGLDITFGYVGKDNSSRTYQLYDTVYDTDTSLNSEYVYYDGGYRDEYYKIDTRVSFTFMPKWKALKYKNTYFYVGLPIFLSLGFKEKSGSYSFEQNWSTNLTSNLSDDYIASTTEITSIHAHKYKTWIGYGIVLGGVFSFDSVPGLELSFVVGFRFGPSRKTSQDQLTSIKKSYYNSNGDLVRTESYPQGYGSDTQNGTFDKDSTGTGTLGTGSVMTLTLTYYFM